MVLLTAAGYKAKDKENSRSEQTCHQPPDAGEIQQQLLQTPEEESTIDSQEPPSPDQPAEIQESTYVEEGTSTSFEGDTTALTRRAEDSVQGRVDDEVHENHQRGNMMRKKSVRQRFPTQLVECQERSIFFEGEMGSSRREGDKTEITEQQVRIFDGAHEKHQNVDMRHVKSESVSELSHTLGNGVACVQTTSLQDNISIEESTSPPESTLLVTGRHKEHSKRKTPVHDDCDSSVQIPSPGIQTTQFVFERHYPSVPRNETHVSVHFLPSQDISMGEVCALISRMEEQPGTKLVPFRVQHVGIQESPRYLNTAFIAAQVTVRFKLVNQVQRNFRLKDPRMAERVITVPQIQSLSQRCLETPGAEARVCVESLGEVGQLRQDHLRIILDYGETTQNLLLPIH
ncbi:uncharacterized protein LOC144653879 isoform X1 [Oculina patagonica]